MDVNSVNAGSLPPPELSPACLGDLGTPALVIPGFTPVSELATLFASDQHLRAVVVEHNASFALLTREKLHDTLTGRLGYGAALNVRAAASQVVAGCELAMPAELDLPAAAQAVLDKPEHCRYEDLLVLTAEGHRVVSVSEVFQAVSAVFHRASLHDPLTGLPNRRMLEERGLRASSGAGLSGIGILFVDVDNFKAVNDTYGHRVGDAVLAEFARILLGCARSTDSVVRLGGDEFAFLLVNVDAVTACAVAKQVLDSLRAPFQHDGHELNLGATIGLAMGEDVSEEDELSAVEVLLRHADAAMLRAKLEGKGRLGRIIARHEPSRFAREAHIRRRLPHVLSDAALSLHYQPVRDLATDEDAGVEALLRWTDRDLGTIAPDEFIPVAEHTGEIHRIGAWVIDRACAQARSWIDAGTPRKIAVNVSPLQLATGTLIGDIRSAMMRHNVPARMLEIEITEGAAIVDVPGAAGQLRELIDSGLGVALDDYGAAYSSLSMLRSLPLTTVKIDRTLINEIDTDPYLATIVGELIHMFKALGLRATAEGVERPTQLAVLRGLDCDTAQGYLISRPKPAADFPAAATTAAQNNEGQTGTELPL